MKGTITEVKLSPSGKSYIAQIAGAGYFAKLDSKIDKAVGQAIDFSIDPNNYKGKTVNWIKDWDFDRAAPVQVGVAIPAQVSQVITALPKAQPNGDRWWLPFVSNQCAHAIAAGQIKGTADLRSWAAGAKAAIEAADGNDAPF